MQVIATRYCTALLCLAGCSAGPNPSATQKFDTGPQKFDVPAGEVWCPSQSMLPSTSDRLTVAKRTWAAARLNRYTFSIRHFGFSMDLTGPRIVTVIDGVARAADQADPEAAEATSADPTMEAVFDIVANDLAQPISSQPTTVCYDETYGYPVVILFCSGCSEYDGYIVGNFTPTS